MTGEGESAVEKEGIVSVWTGKFENEEALMKYAAEDYYDDEGNEVVSPFNKDFFHGEMWPFDPDFWERGFSEVTADPETLVFHFSEGLTIGEGLKGLFPEGLEYACNAAILVYNYQYDGDADVPGAPVKFLAAVPYE